MTEEELSYITIQCAYEVHTHLGAGLLESAYQECLTYELTQLGFQVEVEKHLPISYKELTVQKAYRMDIVVNNWLVLELKVVDNITNNHLAQLHTYLKFSKIKYGLILNFAEKSLRNRIRRVVRHNAASWHKK